MSSAGTLNVVIPGFMPGIHRAACSGVRGWLDPGDKPRNDTAPEWLVERGQ
jgi:hypothetical protein